MKQFLPLLALLACSPVPAPAAVPYTYDAGAIVRVDCPTTVGTAFKVGEDDYVTAAHVVDIPGCTVAGKPITAVNPSGTDFAIFKGPKSDKKLPYVCSGFTAGEEYLAVGHAFGDPLRTESPLIASKASFGAYQGFIGEIIPGESGGPVIDAAGRVVGIINMRWPARSVPLSSTFMCKDK